MANNSVCSQNVSKWAKVTGMQPVSYAKVHTHYMEVTHKFRSLYMSQSSWAIKYVSNNDF